MLATKWLHIRPQPFEKIFQSLPSGSGTTLAPKLPHLSDAEALCLGALPLIPREYRPQGIITWASELFAVSRPSIYALGRRIERRMLSSDSENQSLASSLDQAESGSQDDTNWVEVTPMRLKRTILAATFPGNVSIRPTQEVLKEAFGQRPSIGTISELRLESGRQAGRILAGLDFSAIGDVIVGWDETFFQGILLLLVIDPVSSHPPRPSLPRPSDRHLGSSTGTGPGARSLDCGAGGRHGPHI